MLAALLVVVPGIIVACTWYVAVPACIAERTGVLASMGRSRDLTSGYRWQIFAVIGLVVSAAVVLTMGITAALVAIKAGPPRS